MKAWLYQVALAFDELLNAIFCDGRADETMSSNCWRMEQAGRPWGFMRPVIDTLFWFDANHCQTSYEAMLLRAKTAPVVLGA